jgi:hypothetical protein
VAITDLGAQAKAWALDEAAKHCLTEDFGVDVCWSPQAAQTPQGVQMIPGWVLLITMRNPLLGQPPIYHLAPVGIPVTGEEQMRAEVGKGIRMLRDLAATQLAGINGGAPKMPLIPGR